MLTLRPCFEGDNRQDLLRRVGADDPCPPRQVNRAIAEDLETIVLKAMAKEAKDRYATAQEMADDLRRFLEDEPIRARRPALVQRVAKWSRRHKVMVRTAAVSATLFLLFALVLLGISNLLISGERDQKQQALSDLTAAYQQKNEALATAERNLNRAEAEHRRAEANLDLAMDALEALYVEAIGKDRLLGSSDDMGAQEPLSDREKKLLETGLRFYAEVAQQNEHSPETTFQAGKAHWSIGMVQANLDEPEAAEKAYAEAIVRFKKLTESSPDNAEYFKELGKAYYAQGDLSRWWPNQKSTFVEAQRALSRGIELNPKDAEAYGYRGLTYGRLSQSEKAVADFVAALELEPDVAQRHYRLAWRVWRSKHPSVQDGPRALKHARRAVELEPDEATYRAFLGELLWSVDEDLKNALKELDKAIELAPDSSSGYVARSQTRQRSGDAEKALQDAEKAVELGPENGFAYMRRAAVLRELKRLDEALADLATSERLHPNNPWLYYHRADIYLDRGEEERALEDLNKGLELNPMRSQAYVRRAAAFEALKRFDDALAEYGTAERLDATNPWLYFQRAELYLHRGQNEEALGDLSKGIELKPDHSYAYKRRALLRFNRGEYQLALADVAKAVEVRPDDWSCLTWITPWQTAQCPDPAFREGILALADKTIEAIKDASGGYVARGGLHRALKSYEQAIADYSKAIELEPKEIGHRWRRAAACTEAGQLEQAVADYSKIIELSPGEAWPWLSRGEVYKKLGRTDEAQADFDKCIEMRTKRIEQAPDDWSGWWRRGLAHGTLGAWDKAAADTAKAVDLGTNRSWVWSYCAVAHLAAGDLDGYRDTCAGMSKRFSQTEEAYVVESMVWTCTLGPDALGDPELLVLLAERAVAADRASYDSLRYLGAALYRAGRIEEAVGKLTEAAEAWGREPIKPYAAAQAYTWLFLAMAHHRLGHADESQAWLSKAAQWADGAIEADQPAGWNPELTLWPLYREAKALVRTD
ncbi:MAG: tetratricopeptide repeat protein [Planctomycetota bacterium]|jgi:tetratricopeptide (TPR) repeat protein